MGLPELMNTKDDRKGKAEEMFKIRRGRIGEIIYSLEATDKKMFGAVLDILSEFIVNEKTTYKYLNDEIKFLVRKNIIFADSVSKELVPRSQLTLSAIREVMRDA